MRSKLLGGDGDKKARSPGRLRRKPLKPLRAGMPGDPGATVVTNARAFYTTRAAAGATGTRHSPRPLGRIDFAKRGRIASRECGDVLSNTYVLTLRRRRPPRGLASGEPDDRLQRAIQYFGAPVIESRSRSVPDTPRARSMTASCGAWLFENRRAVSLSEGAVHRERRFSRRRF